MHKIVLDIQIQKRYKISHMINYKYIIYIQKNTISNSILNNNSL